MRGDRRSAGTFPTRKEATKAWQRAETKVAEGRTSDPQRGRQTFRRYVIEEWLPNHVIEVSTKETYTYQIGISTTERYLHTLPDAGDEAVDAFSRIRSRAAQKPA